MTGGTSQVDFEAALQDPQAFFAEPQDVADYPQLSREEKLAILRRWEQDALRLSASESEGIRFGPHPSLGAEQIAHARKLIQHAGKPVAEVAKLLGVH